MQTKADGLVRDLAMQLLRIAEVIFWWACAHTQRPRFLSNKHSTISGGCYGREKLHIKPDLHEAILKL